MAIKKIDEYRQLETEALENELKDLRESLFNLKFKRILGELADHSQIGKTKKNIARVCTILRERT